MWTSCRTSPIGQFWATLLQKSSSSYFSERWDCSMLEMSLIWSTPLWHILVVVNWSSAYTLQKVWCSQWHESSRHFCFSESQKLIQWTCLLCFLQWKKQQITYLHAFPGGNSVDCNSAQIHNQWENLIYSRKIIFLRALLNLSYN